MEWGLALVDLLVLGLDNCIALMDGWSDGWELGCLVICVIDYFFFCLFLFQVFGFDLAVYLLLFEVTGNRCVYYYHYYYSFRLRERLYGSSSVSRSS